jgi:hypothetical protein
MSNLLISISSILLIVKKIVQIAQTEARQPAMPVADFPLSRVAIPKPPTWNHESNE